MKPLRHPRFFILAALCCLPVFAAAPAPALEKRFTNSIGMEFVLIPAGSYMRGCESMDDEKCDSDEKPRRRITISQPFYMQTTEVTQAQWEWVMGNNPSKFKGSSRPVEKVSWQDAQKFIGLLNRMEGGKRYRLPSEAEWEYAARAGSTTRYAFGNDPDELGRYAWYDDNSGEQTHPVARKTPNAWGLYDMHGNVWEWVYDRYGGRYYATGRDTDPLGPDAGEDRVLRGGGLLHNAKGCRSANRFSNPPGNRTRDSGFRLALSPGQ